MVKHTRTVGDVSVMYEAENIDDLVKLIQAIEGQMMPDDDYEYGYDDYEDYKDVIVTLENGAKIKLSGDQVAQIYRMSTED